ncbi:MAG: type II secretion system protein [Lachnospiraceae bacterium]|nr:type II secretion system protein [Lachnospiraceae bacterium]
MKLMRKLMKRNNKGMSLVELICAIAILGLTTTALGGAMVISAQHYKRDSAEFEVQQEAQTATNLIGNLVVDAAEAKWEGNKLKIVADEKIHLVYQDGSKLKYTSTEGGVTTEGVLAEGVAPNGFTADTSKFESNKNVNVSLVLENDGKEFTSNYNATSRNGELSTTEYAERVCVISMEDEVVIEPNQEFKMKVNVLGMDISEVGGLKVNRAGVPSIWDTDDVIKYDSANKEIVIKAPYDAGKNGVDTSFTFEVETIGTKTGSTDKWATKTVQVRVRRVNDIELNLVSGSGFTAGSVYEFKTNLSGTNMSKGFGKSYDLAPYDYIDPNQVQFIARTSAGVSLPIIPVGNDGCKITLNTNIGFNESFTVFAVAKHPEGTNKATVQNGGTNVAYGVVIDSKTYTNTMPYVPPVTFPEGIQRGMDFVWNSTLDSTIDKSALEAKYGTVSPHWYIRYIDEDGNATQYYPTIDNGAAKKFHGNNETLVMLPNKAYTIELIYVFLDGSNKIVWPQDSNLLNAGLGFAEAGVGKGWADEDATVTQFAQYGGSHTVPAAELYYINKASDSDDNYTGVGADVQVNTVNMTLSFSGAGGNPKQIKANFDIRHLLKGGSSADGVSQEDKKFTYEYKIWKKGSDNKWAALDAETSALLRFEKDNSGNGGYFSIWDINDRVQGDATKKEKLKGEYRVGVDLKMYWYKYADTASVFNNTFDYEQDTWNLYDTSKDNTADEIRDGFFYFNIVD